MLCWEPRIAQAVIIVFSLLSSSTFISANDNLCDTSFNELVLEGLTSHPSIEVSKKIVTGADLQLRSAKWDYYATQSIDVSKSANKAQLTLRIDQPLWDGGKINAVRDKAQARKTEATFVYAESQYQLIENYLNTLQKYLQAQDKIIILNSGIDELEFVMQTIDRMISVGELSIADKNLLSTKIADIHSSLEITKAEFDVAKIQFEILTGYKLECDIYFNDRPIFSSNINIESLVHDALNFSPSLKILNARVEQAKSDVYSAESKLLPTLKLRGEHRQGSLYDRNYGDKESLIYLVFEMSTGAGASVLTNIGRSEIKVLQVENEKLSKEKEVIDKLMNNYTRFVAVKNNLKILSNDVLVAEKVFDSNKRLFFLQQKKWIDVVNALTTLNTKRVSKALLLGEYKVLEMRLALKTNRLSLETGGFLSEVLH